ncbi:UBP-type zinc finger domain-containing protein [Hymenobacter norwichensis]|uniref:UBP-type zinc finger domain-containing protein n=1 Tax=Hymenobacter norwichensis TaxID=223903 RepID=UPI000400E67C|nr:UBP-type zinc finger domain-containing protein [Hymenobacter norwichensis]
MAICSHLSALTALIPAAEHVCPDCVALGDKWVHLRVCQECGHVGCCDQSKNKHATKHFRATEHPVIISAEPGEQWAWCYVDEQMAEY